MSETDLTSQFYEMLQESQWWSPDELQAYQRNQLKQLLRHAKANVPFYQGRLDRVFRADGDIDWNRWGEIPIVTRQDLIDHGDDMLARVLPKGHQNLTISTTSGSSGAPITPTSTQVAQIAINANRYRAYKWHNIDWTDVVCALVGEDSRDAAWPDGGIGGPWGPPWDPDSIDGVMLRIDRTTPPERLLEFLDRKRPAYLTGGTNRAYALAVTARRLGATLKFSAFLPTGEAVTDRARAAVHDTFGARTVDLYSSKEAGAIAHLCPTGNGLHVNAESILLELVDAAGRPVGPGEQGRVVVTPLFNAAQPLIRYDQGDFASFADPCSCGRHLPTLTRIIGRSTTLFYHPDGRVVTSFLGMYRHLLKCEAWQVAQTGPTSFEVRYVPIDPNQIGDEEAVADRIREVYFSDSEVRFHRLEEIPTDQFGKPREYVNEWMPSNG